TFYSASVFFIVFMQSLHRLPTFPTRRSSDLIRACDFLRHFGLRQLRYRIFARREIVAQKVVAHELRVIVGVDRNILVLRHVEQRSEEHTSELQSRFELVCILLLEKQKYHSLL